ncbi:MAG: hypothetical protein OXI41_07490 [Chloroflexota bacterium]|nr:hypothetical protein [Chloroflexota bacterium]MDE2895904.1 hypothetical protein [Chloroflexota bacterium]
MDTVAALFSGFVAGAAVGVLGLGIFGPLLVSVPTTNWLRRQFPDPSNWVMVSLGAALVAQAGCAVLGLLLGVVLLNVADGGSSGLGSPTWQFTLGIILVLSVLAVGAIAWQPWLWRRMTVFALIAAGCYGWMLPHLAAA